MKGFFSLFSDSAKELKNVRTLTVAGVFMALAIVLRFIAIPIGQDIRISFAFLALMVIGALYGPVVAMMADVGVDVIGYILDGSKMRDYNLLLMATVLLSGLISGCLMYHRKSEKELLIMACVARFINVAIVNLCFKSMILYGCYVNRDFPFSGGWGGFFAWCTPRLISESIQLPINIFMLLIFFPLVLRAYKTVFHKSLI